MCSSLISYPTEQVLKLIFVREILLLRPYEACENSNTDTEELLGFHDRRKRGFLCFDLKNVNKYDDFGEGF